MQSSSKNYAEFSWSVTTYLHKNLCKEDGFNSQILPSIKFFKQ